MPQYVDLSHDFENNMPGFKMKNEDGTYTQYTAKIYPFLTHKQTLPKFNNLCSFEITEMVFQTSIGTYLDSPYHRYPDGRDISQIKLKDVILDGIVVDVRGKNPLEALGADVLLKNVEIKNKAVLFNFGWDKYWGKEKYHRYPYISKEFVEQLIQKGVKMVGVDTINIDNFNDLRRPAHSLLLENDILIVENLVNLHLLLSKKFRLYAVPLKAKKTAAMPIRAFAEVL